MQQTRVLAVGGSTAASGRITALTLGAAVAASALVVLQTPATAYTVDWPNQTFEQPDPRPRAPVVAPRKHAARHRNPTLATAPATGKDTAKPVGPLIIAISIEKQHLRMFDANGLFAESPVSTGMRGHSTPMGVFSIIQKSKWHRSNIYSGAPMPYMQRITWSGVALHAGVLPGYPASHGCIRMPMAFATKLWGWSRMGARVVIAPGDVSPQDISHPVLITRVTDLPAAAALSQETPAAQRADQNNPDKAADATPARREGADLVRFADAATPSQFDASASLPKSEPKSETKSETKPESKSEVAAPSKADEPPPAATVPDRPETAAAATAGSDAAAVQATKSHSPISPSTDIAKDQGRIPDGITEDTARPAAAAAASSGVTPKPTATAEVPPKPEAAKADGAKAETPAAATPRRTGHIAVLISRKENRMFVRQNFEPLFDVPITIAPGDRPLGTHVFTARADAGDAATYRWSVVSLPTLPKRTDARAEDTGRRPKRPAVVETPAPTPSGPAEALDRITVPPDATARIAAALATGGSIVVSDLGLGGETGLGTDFIVPLR